ncbi:MAG: helix-hairpin-helix domain-containing protein [Bacteroidota bacterium]|nr:helix-hairpin-helix domain-containing protein [Bacteroidota bacterium]
MMHTLVIFIALMLIMTVSNAQNVVINEAEYEQEELKSRNEIDPDLSDRDELLERLAKNPIPVNFAEPDQLSAIPWLNDLQIKNLILYRNQFGYILTPYELQLIEGFDRETIESVIPYISFTTDKNKQSITARKFFKEGHEDVLIRPSGVGKPKDSSYFGSSFKLLIKYKYDWQGRVTTGFTFEKDPGETLFKKPLERIPGFDFASVYGMISNTGIVKRLIIGDYHLRFGQGLALWSGYNIGRTIFASGYLRKAPGIVQNSSAIESGFMRGVASTLCFKRFNITGFLSISPWDGRLDTLKRITGFVTDGLHRDSVEWLRRHNTVQTTYGGRIALKHDVSEVGINFVDGFYSNALAASSVAYRRYDLKRTRFGNLSLDHRIVLGRVLLSGEVAASRMGYWALIQNILFQPVYGYSFYFSVRDYSPVYRAPYGNCLGESGLPQNEKGLFAAATMMLSSKVTIRTYADFYHYPWLKYRIDAPSSGYEQQLQLEWKASPYNLLILRIGNKDRPLNLPVDSNILNKVENQHRLNIRLDLKSQIFKQITLQSRLELNRLSKTAGTSTGYLLLQDLAWKDKVEKLSFSARLAYYSSSYDNRFYTYEHDHLFSFTTPMLYGRGIRMYLFGHLRFMKKQSMSFKIGYNKKNIASTDTVTTTEASVANSSTSNSLNPLEFSVQFVFKI